MIVFGEGLGLSSLDFQNTTDLRDARLEALLRAATAGWNTGHIVARVRFSRSADFSGSCHYRGQKIFVNIGRHVVYPYRVAARLAKAKVIGRRWYKPVFTVEVADGYQLALYVFLHELYHLLVKRARRNTRQKESMCDRFAAGFLVDRFSAVVRDHQGHLVDREDWAFQDLDGFVAAVRCKQGLVERADSYSVVDGPVGVPH